MLGKEPKYRIATMQGLFFLTAAKPKFSFWFFIELLTNDLKTHSCSYRPHTGYWFRLLTFSLHFTGEKTVSHVKHCWGSPCTPRTNGWRITGSWYFSNTEIILPNANIFPPTMYSQSENFIRIASLKPMCIKSPNSCSEFNSYKSHYY